MTRQILLITTLLCAGAISRRAQSLSFEVASIKPSAPNSLRGASGSCRGTDTISDPTSNRPLGRCVITDARLNHILSVAYGLPLSQIRYSMARQPDWIDGRFDIEAKADDPSITTESQLLAMLQALLSERFKLKLHRETQQADGYALVIAKNGFKLQRSTSERSFFSILGGVGNRATVEDAKRNLVSGTGPVVMTVRRASMSVVTQSLAIPARSPVVDRTDLHDAYDFELMWDESAGPSFFTALQEQLGLRLVPQKMTIDILVIDAADRPTAN